MPTNLAIDDALLSKAKKIAQLKTKRETVEQALRELIDRRLRLRAIEAFGTIDFAPRFDHKKHRRK
jgi:Arc/MetJ family transcription regulator